MIDIGHFLLYDKTNERNNVKLNCHIIFYSIYILFCSGSKHT